MDEKPVQEHGNNVETGFDRTWRDEQWTGHRALSIAAAQQAESQKTMTPLDCIKAYPMAIFWSLITSTCVIMEGYDTILIGNFFAYPTFQEKYGSYVGVSPQTPSGYTLTAAWQAGIGQAAGVGAFFGAIACGYLVAIFGSKRVLLVSLVCLSALLFIVFFAPNIGVLLAGEILCGLPWGIFATLAPAYASEVLPLPLRVYLTSYTNMCFIIGQLIAAGVLEGLVSRTDQWGYRIPFAIQWFWPAFLIPILFFAPESPWYLVRQNRLDDAEKSLRRLVRASTGIDVKATLAEIVYTNNLEEELSVGTSYWDCFSGFERRRTEIACVSFAGQVLSGSTFAYNASYFFQNVGLSTSLLYKLNLGGTGLALFGTLINWFILMPYFGRRTVYLWGMFFMATELIIIGILNVWTDSPNVALTQAALTLIWTFTFQLSAGQLGWALPAEVGSTRLRQKTVCVARNAYYIVSVISGVLEPYFMNPTAWNLRGYTGFFWGGTAALTFVWAFFRLPETKNRPYHDLDILFAKNVPARKFKTTQVNAFDEADTSQLAVRYSVADLEARRPSMVPSVSKALARTGKDEAYSSQRRASLAPSGGVSRRPSIAAAVTDYLNHGDRT